MAKIAAAFVLLLFGALARAIVVLPDASITFLAAFEEPNEAVEYLKRFLSERGFVENGRKANRSDGVFSASFRSHSKTRKEVAVSGQASGDRSGCTVVDFYFFVDGYDLDAHTKGRTRNETVMAEALELASELASWLRTSGAENVKVWKAEESDGRFAPKVCMRSNNALERPVTGLALGAAGAFEDFAPAAPSAGFPRPAQRGR